MSSKPGRHPYARWHWWQAAGMGLLAFGGFGLLLTFLPEFAPAAAAAGLALALAGTLAGLWNWQTFSWGARLATASVLALELLLIGIRAWAALDTSWWLWLPTLLVVVLAAWALPVVRPRLSAVLWREQVAPRTRAGRGCLALALAVAPIAGVLGGGLGMYGSRFGQTDLVWLALGTLGTMSAVGISFSTAHQLWPERPWASKSEQAAPPSEPR